MKIATYNVWYENINIRTKQLIEEINNTDADVIGLQEVPPDFYKQLIAQINYPYYVYNEKTQLAFLSRHPLNKPFSLFEQDELSNSVALNAIINVNGITISITNVHLPWDSALLKEKQIVEIDGYIHSQREDAQFFILLGDFNCTLSSSVHHYLLGDQSLLDCEAKPYWNDLLSVYATLKNIDIPPTLDFVNNPRWKGKNTNYLPLTYDRIYIMESFNWDYEFQLRNATIFGKKISDETGYAPSDHYGVLADVEFKV